MLLKKRRLKDSLDDVAGSMWLTSMEDLVLLSTVGIRPILVHGGDTEHYTCRP